MRVFLLMLNFLRKKITAFCSPRKHKRDRLTIRLLGTYMIGKQGKGKKLWLNRLFECRSRTQAKKVANAMFGRRALCMLVAGE